MSKKRNLLSSKAQRFIFRTSYNSEVLSAQLVTLLGNSVEAQILKSQM